MPRYEEPSPQELHALSILWNEGPSTVGAVHEILFDGDDRTYTTTLAVMRNLEKKKLATRTKEGRAHIYSAGCKILFNTLSEGASVRPFSL